MIKKRNRLSKLLKYDLNIQRITLDVNILDLDLELARFITCLFLVDLDGLLKLDNYI